MILIATNGIKRKVTEYLNTRPFLPHPLAGVHHTGEPSQQEWERVTRQLEQVLSETGCAYLTQHGLPDDLVRKLVSPGGKVLARMDGSDGSGADDNVGGVIHLAMSLYMFLRLTKRVNL